MLARRLQSRPRPREGLGDLLGWAFLIDEGTVLMKDGALLTGWRLEPRDLASATAAEVTRVSNAIHESLDLLGDSMTLEVNVHRRHTTGYSLSGWRHFPTPALRALESERADQFNRPGIHYATTCTALVTYFPPKEASARWERLVVQGPGRGLDYEHILTRFRTRVAEAQALLSTAFAVQSLSSDDLLRECHQSLTGLDHPVHTPDASYLSHTLASCDLECGYCPRLDGQYLLICTINGLGSSTSDLAGAFVLGMHEQVRWHMRFVGLSRHGAARRIRRLQTRWFHQRGGLRRLVGSGQDGFEDQDALSMQQETGDALEEATSRYSRFGYLSNAFILRDANLERGQERAHALLQVLRDQGFTGSLETFNATDAFIGSLPGHGYANLRRPIVSSRNVAHLFPVSMPWRGDPVCPNPIFPDHSPALTCVRTRGHDAFYLNLYQGDVGHTLIVGATGAGKSVLVGFMALNFLRYAKSRVHVFDLGYSHHTACLAAGGIHHDLRDACVQPLRWVDREEDRLWALNWIESLYELAGSEPSAQQRLELANALILLRDSEPDARTLASFRDLLPVNLQYALERYTSPDAFGTLFNGSQDRAESARMEVYESGAVMELGDAVVVPLLLALFRRIERKLDGTPTLIVVEEAWAALLRSRFAEQIKAWLLTLRKRNAAVVLVAHSPAQIQALPNAALITESCPTKILLPNPEAETPVMAPVYAAMDLNPREIAQIASAYRKREYYYKSPRGGRLFELDLGPVARTLLMPLAGMTPDESRKRVEAAVAAHGDDFLKSLTIDP